MADDASEQLSRLAVTEEIEGDVFAVVLVGVTGEGKSSTGNTLCGREAFEVSGGLCSATAKCAHADYLQLGACGITRVIDTLGLQDTDLPASEVMRRFSLFADHTPLGINAFLFVVRWGRFKPEHEVSARRLESTPISVPTTRPVSRQLESSSLSKGVLEHAISLSQPTD